MTIEEWQEVALPIEITPENLLTLEAGLEWILEKTTIEFDPNIPKEIESLPARARLFLMKFLEISTESSGISSESIGGMSQSFDTGSRDSRLWKEAEILLSGLLKSQVIFVTAKRKW